MIDRRSGCRDVWGSGAVVLLAVVLLVSAGVRAQEAPVLAADRVVVVPFDNISGSAEDAWLGAGIAETVTAGLSGSTVALGSVTRVLDAAAGEQLGARWVVSGSYQRLGDQLRVTARVMDESTGMVVGAVTVDGVLAGFFALQDLVVAALVPVLAGLVPGGRGVEEVWAPAPSAAAPERTVLAPGVIDGPPPPVAPAVINRDTEGGGDDSGDAADRGTHARWSARRVGVSDGAGHFRLHPADARRRCACDREDRRVDSV